MTKIVLLYLITSFCFGQKIKKPEFSTIQIDSMSKNESCFKIFDYRNKIHQEKIISNGKSKILGDGFGTWKINAHFIDSLYFNSLNRQQKRKYDDRNTCLIIRGDYLSFIKYDDRSTETEAIYFYFNSDKIFYVKYQKDNYFLEFPFIDIDKILLENKYLKEYLTNKADEIQNIWNNR